MCDSFFGIELLFLCSEMWQTFKYLFYFDRTKCLSEALSDGLPSTLGTELLVFMLLVCVRQIILLIVAKLIFTCLCSVCLRMCTKTFCL